MQTCGTSTVDYVHLVDLLGVHFQIRDDYINLISTTYHDTKGFAEDLTEGKFSFPIVHYITNNPDKASILLSKELNMTLDILRQRTENVDVKKYAISLLRDSGSLEYARQYLIAKEAEARAELERLGGNHILENMLSFLSKEYL